MVNGYELEEINNAAHPLLMQAILLINARLKPGQVPGAAAFQEAIANKKKWFPDNYHLIIIKYGNTVVAAAAGYYIAEINAGFINYVVIDPKHEGEGLAQTIRSALLNSFQSDSKQNDLRTPIGYLGEVEHDNPWLQKLIIKYGVIPLDIPYVQPPLQHGNKPIPLVLYFQPHEGATIKMEKDFVVKIIKAIYESVYDLIDVEKKEYFKKIKRAKQ